MANSKEELRRRYPLFSILYLRPAKAYFAVSALMFVWKMAIQTPFSDFQTVPQLNVPEASFPSTEF